jgi:TonB-linked SusC/RagA family outer membrane protein
MKKDANSFAHFHYAQKCCVSWLMKLCIVVILFSPTLVKASQTSNFGNIEQNQNTVTGVVTSADDGLSIPGVSVVVKGTSNGTSTDFDGKFSIQAEEGQTLIFSFVGMTTQEVVIKGNSLNIVLESENLGLDEVIVVGYGTQKKSDLTGSVASIKASDLQKTPSSNPVDGLQGKVAGVSISKFGGAPGSGSNIVIRGVGTIGSNTPLYIIDGLPGDMSLVNPGDIASIEILKDGAAAAIYGSRAANGVVLISTKKGKSGKTTIDFNMYTGVKQSISSLDLLDSEGYVAVHKMMYDNYNQYSSDPIDLPSYITTPISHSTDWQKEVFRNAVHQNYNLNINGGTENSYYGVSGSWNDEEGTAMGSEYLKKTFRAKLGTTRGRFSIDANISYAETEEEEKKFSLREVYKITPIIPTLNEDGTAALTFGDLPSNTNPFAPHMNESGENKTQYFSGNITGRFKITDWLSYQVNLGFINSNEHNWYHKNAYERDHKDKEDYVSFEKYQMNWRKNMIEHLINFNKTFGKHSVSAVAGFTAEETTQDWMKASVIGKNTEYSVEDGSLVTKDKPAGFLDPSWITLSAGEGGTYAASGSKSKYTRTSILGRVNYSFESKYLFQFTFRRDGSSKFGSEYRYGTFPSVALGWRFSEESFMNDFSFIDNMKLRASWGKLGNDGLLENYQYQSLIYTANDYTLGSVKGSGANPWPGSIATQIPNSDLRWETTTSRNLGLDYTLLGNRFSGSINYYINTTKDLLIPKTLATSSGDNEMIANVGEVENKGIEFELGYNNHSNKFKYSINATFSTSQNEVTKLANKDQAIFGEGLKYGDAHFPTQTRQGYEIGSFFLYKTDGIFQSNEEVAAHKNSDGDLLQENAKAGDIRFIDTNNDGSIDEADKVYSGSGIPDFNYSLSLNASYEGFDFSCMFYGVSGNKLYNGNRYYLENMSAGQNFLASTANAWTESNKNTNMPRAVLGDPNLNNRESDRFLENASFLRLKNVELGYSLPKSVLTKLGVSKLRIFVNAQNVFTITDYSGTDPELGRADVKNIGIDRSFYPLTKSYYGGIQLSF